MSDQLTSNLNWLVDNLTLNGQKELAESVGLSAQAIQQWCSGATRPRGKNLAKVAAHFGLMPSELEYEDVSAKLSNKLKLKLPREGTNVAKFLAEVGIKQLISGEQKTQIVSVPLISWVKAGAFESIEDYFRPGEADEWIVVYDRKVSEQTFALKVVGDSMQRDKDPSFDEGDILICDPNLEAKPGDFVIAKNTVDQTATFKRMTYDGIHHYLMPLNPMYQPIVMNNGDFRVIARVVQRIKVSTF